MELQKLHFTTSDGVELVVPFFLDAVTREGMKKVNKLALAAGGLDKIDDDELLKAAAFDKDTMAVINKMSMRDYLRFISEWAEESTVGESSN